MPEHGEGRPVGDRLHVVTRPLGRASVVEGVEHDLVSVHAAGAVDLVHIKLRCREALGAFTRHRAAQGVGEGDVDRTRPGRDLPRHETARREHDQKCRRDDPDARVAASLQGGPERVMWAIRHDGPCLPKRGRIGVAASSRDYL